MIPSLILHRVQHANSKLRRLPEHLQFNDRVKEIGNLLVPNVLKSWISSS